MAIKKTLASAFFIASVVAGMEISQAQTSPPTPTATMTGIGTGAAVPVAPEAAPLPTTSAPSAGGATAAAPGAATAAPPSASTAAPPSAPAATGGSNIPSPPELSSLIPKTIDPIKLLGDQITEASHNDNPQAKAKPSPTPLPYTGPTMLNPMGAIGPDGLPMQMPSPTPSAQKETFTPSEVQRYVPGNERVGDPRAILHTSFGDITIRLFADLAPRTVRNFIDLARGERDFVDSQTSKHTRRPFYSDLIFHRILPPYLIQTGCPFGTGRGGPGYTIPDEVSRILTFEKAGMVAMAPERNDKDKSFAKDSNGSQFFITMQPMPIWDGNFTIFGEVERGMNVVRKIASVKTGPTDRPIRKVYLKQVEVIDEVTSKTMPHDKPAAGAAPEAPGTTGEPPPSK